ncbi:MAG: DMT family transporter [Thermoleophilaceae bacterium]
MFYLFAAAAGLLNAIQAGANAGLGKALDNKFAAGAAILAINMAVMLLAGAVSGQLGWPGLQRIAGAPWWAWTGGLLATVFILAQLFTAEQLGSAVFMTITVTAAVSTSLLLDHFGLVGFKEHPLGWGRAAGAVLILAGLGLIARY